MNEQYFNLTHDEALEVWNTKRIPMGRCDYCLDFFPMAHFSELEAQRHITFQDEICVECYEEKKSRGGYGAEGFGVIAGRGFQMEFPNGYRVSVVFAPGNYGDHHDNTGDMMEHSLNPPQEWDSRTAELAVFKPEGGLLDFGDEGDQVRGWINPAFVSEMFGLAAKGDEEGMKELAMKSHLYGAEGLEFTDWANQETKHHGKTSLKDWADHEIKTHGGKMSFQDWAKHEDKSHIRRFGAESIEVWEMIQQNLNNPDAVREFYRVLVGDPDEFTGDDMALVVAEAYQQNDNSQEFVDWVHKELFSAEELKKDSCCCGATKSKPCACMIQGVMECSDTCPCSVWKELREGNWGLNEIGKSKLTPEESERLQIYGAEDYNQFDMGEDIIIKDDKIFINRDKIGSGWSLPKEERPEWGMGVSGTDEWLRFLKSGKVDGSSYSRQGTDHFWGTPEQPYARWGGFLTGESTLNAENWGGDPKGKLAQALEKARKKAKKVGKTLKIEKLEAEELCACGRHGCEGTIYSWKTTPKKCSWCFDEIMAEYPNTNEERVADFVEGHFSKDKYEYREEVMSELGLKKPWWEAETSGQWEIGEQLEEAQMNAENYRYVKPVPISHSGGGHNYNGYYAIKGYEKPTKDGFTYRILSSPGTKDWYRVYVYDDEKMFQNKSRRLNPSGEMVNSSNPASHLIGSFPRLDDAKRALVFRMIQDEQYYHILSNGNLNWLLYGKNPGSRRWKAESFSAECACINRIQKDESCWECQRCGEHYTKNTFSIPATKGIDTFTEPFDELSLDSGNIKKVIVGIGIGVVGILAYRKRK